MDSSELDEYDEGFGFVCATTSFGFGSGGFEAIRVRRRFSVAVRLGWA